MRSMVSAGNEGHPPRAVIFGCAASTTANNLAQGITASISDRNRCRLVAFGRRS